MDHVEGGSNLDRPGDGFQASRDGSSVPKESSFRLARSRGGSYRGFHLASPVERGPNTSSCPGFLQPAPRPRPPPGDELPNAVARSSDVICCCCFVLVSAVTCPPGLSQLL